MEEAILKDQVATEGQEPDCCVADALDLEEDMEEDVTIVEAEVLIKVADLIRWWKTW